MDELVLFIIFCGSSLIVAVTLLYAIYLNETMKKLNNNMSVLEDNTVKVKRDVKILKDQTIKLSRVIAKQDEVADHIKKEMDK